MTVDRAIGDLDSKINDAARDYENNLVAKLGNAYAVARQNFSRITEARRERLRDLRIQRYVEDRFAQEARRQLEEKRAERMSAIFFSLVSVGFGGLITGFLGTTFVNASGSLGRAQARWFGRVTSNESVFDGLSEDVLMQHLWGEAVQTVTSPTLSAIRSRFQNEVTREVGLRPTAPLSGRQVSTLCNIQSALPTIDMPDVVYQNLISNYIYKIINSYENREAELRRARDDGSLSDDDIIIAANTLKDSNFLQQADSIEINQLEVQKNMELLMLLGDICSCDFYTHRNRNGTYISEPIESPVGEIVDGIYTYNPNYA